MSRRPLVIITLILTLVLVLIGPTAALAAPPDMQKVLIAFDRQPGPNEEALVRGVGGNIKYTYHLVPAIAASVPAAAIEGLQRNPRVIRVEPDIEAYAVTDLDNTWGVERIGAGMVHSSNTGAGVKIAIIDSGVDYNHMDLVANYVGGKDLVNGDNDPMDDNGHGTHVAGTIAALDNNGGVVGVAPGASIYALKVLGANGSGSYSNIIAALQWAVNNGIQVTNNSYGSSGYPGDTVKAAFDNAYAAGVLNIAAAGNGGNTLGTGDNVIYPARWASVVAVAATDFSDSRANWSSTGSTVELSAPGVNINSTLMGGGYGLMSGTSMASPHVAGTAALVIASGVAITPAAVRLRLQQTASDLGAPGLDSMYGYGLVNAQAAADITLPPPSVTTMHVAGISMTTTSRRAGSKVFTSAIAAVTVLDANNLPVGGATVSGHWKGATTDTDTGITGSSGQVSLKSNEIKNARRGTTFTFVIDNVSLAGAVWADSPGAKSGSITLQ